MILLIALELSLGLGFDIGGKYQASKDGFKGIIQIEEQLQDGYTAGFWHSSELDNGFKGNVHDENIFYIKKTFYLNKIF